MSLDWSIARVKNWEEVRIGSGPEGTKTNALIWAMLTIGMSGITEKNANEVFLRINACQKLDGVFFHIVNDGKLIDTLFTKEDINRRIGLTTNANTVSDRAWWARVMKKLRSAT